MRCATPVLRIDGDEDARRFYVESMGFTIDWEWRHEPHFPVFMSVTRGAVTLFLSEHEGDCQPGGAVYMLVDDVDALYEEFTSKGLVAHMPPTTQAWRQRECVFLDPFGNRLTIATPQQG
ncbi:Glyoxalase-like domain protein [Planctomycetes bacterium Pan216]|uniref:Bleomycin resistance protein n=1 Tax=Kolteria novifilia TaxID=2527975 RepID=A0A518B3N5_9BACT|nr:Glyoxalase-like domain protein [Planctomycetes bacterium Pan216]